MNTFRHKCGEFYRHIGFENKNAAIEHVGMADWGAEFGAFEQGVEIGDWQGVGVQVDELGEVRERPETQLRVLELLGLVRLSVGRVQFRRLLHQNPILFQEFHARIAYVLCTDGQEWSAGVMALQGIT